MNRAGFPENGRARTIGNHPTGGPGNRNETTENSRSSTLSATSDVSKHFEECPELTEESLLRLEQGLWELSLEIVKLRSRIDTYLTLLLSNNSRCSERRCHRGFSQ
jgi:hypothetical protein